MLVHVHGSGFHNFGAWLMLEVVVKELSRRVEGVRFCAYLTDRSTFKNRSAYELEFVLQKFTRDPRKRIASSFFEISLPSAVKRKVGMVNHRDMNVFLDISGFAFGDQWSHKFASTVSDLVEWHRKQGNPVIFFPQMFGPFKRQETVKVSQKLLEQADLIFARDRESYEVVKSLLGDSSSPMLAPDITIFSERRLAREFNSSNFVGIVPNQRMLDKGGCEWGAIYVQLLTLAGKYACSLGYEVVVLNHAPGSDDQDLVDTVAMAIGGDQVSVYVSDTPSSAKAKLASAQLVIGSRYHAIVGALASCVPAISLGWAHKYPTLLADFGVPEFHFEPTDNIEKMYALMNQCLNISSRKLIVERLSEAIVSHEDSNEAMWGEVVALLETSRSRSSLL